MQLEVIERGEDMVLAAHHTRLTALTVTTVETVHFAQPDRMEFRHVRGPVPYVVESFVLTDTGSGTKLVYEGELGLDLWALGRWWGSRLVPLWERIVSDSMEAAITAADARWAAQARRSRPSPTHLSEGS